MAKDYYQILGIAKNAILEQINKVFRQLAIRCRNPVNTEEAGEKFYEINRAYVVLSD
jgi:DnaJ-class molecular chaperone